MKIDYYKELNSGGVKNEKYYFVKEY